MKPLDGLVVLEFAQYMAAPAAGLKLADLGARVIKIERPGTGEAGRRLAIKNLFVDGDSLVFHTINRNKESYAADLKDPGDLEKIKKLISRADVLTHNFRPGVMKKLGLDYDAVRAFNPRLIYAEVTGYGPEGPWRDKPGQDLLAQSVSGLTWLSGNAGDPPTPMGLAVADMLCGAHLVQGILAALIRRAKTGQGAHVEVSLLESILDFQFEVLTTHLNDGGKLPQRARRGSAHAYLAAPYGIYRTADGYLALAMMPLGRLADLMDCPELRAYNRPQDGFCRRDEIMEILENRLRTRPTAHWLEIFEAAGVWCAEVFDYARLVRHPGYAVLEMEQAVRRPNGAEIHTTRCPIRIDGERLLSPRAAPRVGEHNRVIDAELLDEQET
jgi:crotonobetainyl-CoA:carnitine CoA-transferase CaiB-like acyl-CoA transferase